MSLVRCLSEAVADVGGGGELSLDQLSCRRRVDAQGAVCRSNVAGRCRGAGAWPGTTTTWLSSRFHLSTACVMAGRWSGSRVSDFRASGPGDVVIGSWRGCRGFDS